MELIQKFLNNGKKSPIQVPKQPRKGYIDKESLVAMLPFDPVIVEAGAHVGYDTIEMAKLWSNGTIYSFEPVPNLFSILEKSTCQYTNVYRFNVALANHTGQAKLFVSSGKSDGSSSLLSPKEHTVVHPDVYFEKEIVVKTTTLDDWAEQQKIAKVDFLWLDLQGFELAVLKAMPRIMPSVSVIHTEVSLIEVYDGVPLYPELRNWLELQGFHVVREELPWRDMGNVLFARKSIPISGG